MPQHQALSTFENTRFGAVRVVMRDGEPWFVAKDVASALGYADPSRAVIQHCKKSIKSTILANRTDGTPPLNISLIPEADVYRLIMRSNLPSAEEFQDWVVEEVLPSIRKTGQYTSADANSRKWALRRLDGKKTRRQQTDMMKAAGVSSPRDYAASTAILHQSWSGMTPSKHKAYKHLDRKDALRDHCTYTELSMIDLSEQMHCVKMRNTGASSSQDALACAKDCVSPMQRIAQIYEEATGERIASPLNNLPCSEKKAIDAIHDDAALGSVKILTA